MGRSDDTPFPPASGPMGPPAGFPVGSPAAGEEVDPELLALPAPPWGWRLATLTLMAAVVVASLALASSLRYDVAYFFATSTVADLGEATAVDPAALTTNRYVRITGTPMAAGTVRYRRIVTGETYVVFPFAGQRTIYIHMPESAARSGRTEFAGRLVTFGQLGARMRDVQEYLARTMGMPVSSESFVILVDESPENYWWALALCVLCALFVMVDVMLVVRWFRPIREA